MAVLVDQFLCRTDNYGYLVHDVETRKTVAIDAPDAGAVKAALNHRGWTLTDILITHHHRDHVEGVSVLKSEFKLTVTGPRLEAEKIMGLDVMVAPGDCSPSRKVVSKMMTRSLLDAPVWVWDESVMVVS